MRISKPNLSSIKAKLDDVQLSDIKDKIPNRDTLNKLSLTSMPSPTPR